MALPDMIAYFLEKYGEPQHVRKISASEASGYSSKLPSGMLQFWIEHGRGSYLGGKFWFCDPAPFQAIIDTIFKDDPEFSPADMKLFCHSAFGNFWLWHRIHRCISVNFLNGYVHCPSPTAHQDRTTGIFFPEDFTLGNVMDSIAGNRSEYDEYGEDLLPQAIDLLGELDEGEVYGFFPPPCFGGTRDVTSLRRTPAVEHMTFLAQVCDLQITRLTEPKPGHPFGEIVPVRRPGVQQ
jgi:hypothetical protein